jgi:AraC-like DNA-binding protein
LLENVYKKTTKPLLAWDLYILVHAQNYTEALQLLVTKVSLKMGQVLYTKYDPWLQPLYGNEAFRTIVRNHFSEEINIPKKQTKTKRVQLSNAAVQDVSRKLKALMETEKIYIHPNKLSWLLNEKLGKNFYELVNNYRLQDFQQRALHPKNSHLSVLGLALDSGFNSKSVFNDYFKKTTGITPKAWIQQQR